nr:hypothetical protein [Magnetospirillum molischianum]
MPRHTGVSAQRRDPNQQIDQSDIEQSGGFAPDQGLAGDPQPPGQFGLTDPGRDPALAQIEAERPHHRQRLDRRKRGTHTAPPSMLA